MTLGGEKGKAVEPRVQENSEAEESQASLIAEGAAKPPGSWVCRLEVEGHVGWELQAGPSLPDSLIPAALPGNQAKLVQL